MLPELIRQIEVESRCVEGPEAGCETSLQPQQGRRTVAATAVQLQGQIEVTLAQRIPRAIALPDGWFPQTGGVRHEHDLIDGPGPTDQSSGRELTAEQRDGCLWRGGAQCRQCRFTHQVIPHSVGPEHRDGLNLCQGR